MARGEKAVFAVSGESSADTESSGHGVGKAQAVNLGRGGSLTRLFCGAEKGCKVLERIVLKAVLGEVWKLGNAMKKRSVKSPYQILKNALTSGCEAISVPIGCSGNSAAYFCHQYLFCGGPCG